MIETLKQLGIENIIIADDSDKNISAARQFADSLQGINFEFYQTGDLLIADIPKKYIDMDLILTDRIMETEDKGFDVIEVAINYIIPAYVISGGFQHRNKSSVKVCPGMFGIEGGKDSPETWKQVLSEIIRPDSNGRKMLDSVQRLRQARNGSPPNIDTDFSIGKHTRSYAESYFKYQ